MEKTISVTLNNFAYTLDEDAYQKLQAYLEGIKNYFESTDSKETTEEIIRDIESSIAEKFSSKLSAKKQVISSKDIDELIEVMGTVADITNGDGGQTTEEEKHSTVDSKQAENEEEVVVKRLYRNTDDKIIAGVASGIANYFGIDPVIIRLIFVVSVFTWGFGVMAYLVLWFVVPKAKTVSQKLAMQGEPVTLKKLEGLAKEKAEEIKNIDKTKINGIFKSFFLFLGEVFSALGKFVMRFSSVIGILIGIPIIVASVLAMTAVGFVAAAIVFNKDLIIIEPGFHMQASEIIGQAILPIAAIAIFFVAFVPLLFLIITGASLVGRKNAFNTSSSMFLVGVWMVAVITTGIIALDAAPRMEAKIKAFNADKNSELISREIEVKEFDKIDISHAYEVRVAPGDEYKVVATGREADMKFMDINVYNNELVVGKETQEICLFCYTERIILDITAPNLSQAKLGGASKISVNGFSGDKFDLELSGASQGEMNIDFDVFDIEISGASNLKLELATSTNIDIDISGASKAELLGAADELIADISGASTFIGIDLETKIADMEISGASTARVNVAEKLDTDSSGASKVYYIGGVEVDGDNDVINIDDGDRRD